MTEKQRGQLVGLLTEIHHNPADTRESVEPWAKAVEGVSALIKRLELEARLDEHEDVCRYCENSRYVSFPCDREKELRAQLKSEG